MILKAAGAFMILSGGLMAGGKVRKQHKKVCTELRKMQEALKFADDTITIENMLLDDVLKKCAEKFFEDEKGTDIWTKACENLKTEFGSFENSWAKACDEYFEEQPYYDEKQKECIKGIGKALGIANTQRQSAHVNANLQNLQELEKMAIAKYEKEGKNSVRIAAALSIAVIVLLF